MKKSKQSLISMIITSQTTDLFSTGKAFFLVLFPFCCFDIRMECALHFSSVSLYFLALFPVATKVSTASSVSDDSIFQDRIFSYSISMWGLTKWWLKLNFFSCNKFKNPWVFPQLMDHFLCHHKLFGIIPRNDRYFQILNL